MVLVVGIILSFPVTRSLLKKYLGIFEYIFNFLHGKIMALPSKSTNLRDVDQGLFHLLTYIKTTKVLFCSKGFKKKELWTGNFFVISYGFIYNFQGYERCF